MEWLYSYKSIIIVVTYGKISLILAYPQLPETELHLHYTIGLKNLEN